MIDRYRLAKQTWSPRNRAVIPSSDIAQCAGYAAVHRRTLDFGWETAVKELGRTGDFRERR